MISSRTYPATVNQNLQSQLPTYTQSFSAQQQSSPRNTHSIASPDQVYKAPNLSHAPANIGYPVSAYPAIYNPHNSYSNFKNADSFSDLASAYSAPVERLTFYPASPPDNAQNRPDIVNGTFYFFQL